MIMGYRVVNGKLQMFEDFSSVTRQNNVKQQEATSFKGILEDKLKKDSFVISNHAASRLQDRNISLNESDMKRINEGINKAEQKGCKDCLILYKDVAMVASIKNRTIVTAVDKEASKGNVFTNIDGVVLL
jgi:flagellar operon protein